MSIVGRRRIRPRHLYTALPSGRVFYSFFFFCYATIRFIKEFSVTTPITRKIQRIDVIYHDDCLDGAAAAALIRRYYASDALTFYADDYRTRSAPSKLTGGDLLIIVDFSYPGPMLDELCRLYREVILIDHHASAITDLSTYYFPITDPDDGEPPVNRKPENLKLVMDENRSGAGITWDLLYTNAQRAPLIDRIEDNDIRSRRFPDTPSVVAATIYAGVSLDAVDAALRKTLDELLVIGRAQSEAIDYQARYCIANYMRLTVQGIPYIMAPRWVHSRIGDVMAAESKHELFMAYCLDGDAFKIRLMSPKHGPDCSVLAKAFGGGGHVHASGFHVASTDLRDLEQLHFPLLPH